MACTKWIPTWEATTLRTWDSIHFSALWSTSDSPAAICWFSHSLKVEPLCVGGEEVHASRWAPNCHIGNLQRKLPVMIYQADGYVRRSYLCSSPRFPEKGIKISDKRDFLHVCLFDGISVNTNQSGAGGGEPCTGGANRQTNAFFQPQIYG